MRRQATWRGQGVTHRPGIRFDGIRRNAHGRILPAGLLAVPASLARVLACGRGDLHLSHFQAIPPQVVAQPRQ